MMMYCYINYDLLKAEMENKLQLESSKSSLCHTYILYNYTLSYLPLGVQLHKIMVLMAMVTTSQTYSSLLFSISRAAGHTCI